MPSCLSLMTVLPETTSCLLFLLLLVEFPVLALSHPTPMRHQKDGLTKLFQKLRRLVNIVQGAVVSLMWSQSFYMVTKPLL